MGKQNMFISAVAFDNGDRSKDVLIALARNGDEKRLKKWLEDVKGSVNDNSNVIRAIITSGLSDVLYTLLESYRDDDEFSTLIVKCLIDSKVDLETFKIINHFFTYNDLLDLLRTNRYNIGVLMANTISKDNVELVDELLHIGVPIDTLITQQSNKISCLEYALRVNAEKTIEYLLPLVTIDPHQALLALMYDWIPNEDDPDCITFLLNRYQYSDEELLEVLHHSNSPAKMLKVIDRLNPEFIPRETKYDVSRAFVPR